MDLSKAGGILLDIGCGLHKQPGWTGLDILPLEGVDIVHDINLHPWPLEDESVIMAMCSHLVEHIPPAAIGPQGTWFPFLAFMDEVWRILKPEGQFAISYPYWLSPGFAQDPTHCNPINEVTWAYFDPEAVQGLFYQFYKPKPWKCEVVTFDPSGNGETLLRKRANGA